MMRDLRLRGLSTDHHHALVLVRRIRKGLAGQGGTQALANMIVEQFERELNWHFMVEEELLLPHLTGEARALAERTLSDHSSLRRLVGQMLKGHLDACAQFADVLEAHVRFEERELFPVCEKAVPAAVLAVVAERVAKGRP